MVAKGKSFEIKCAEQILTFEPEDVLIETKSAEGYSCGEEGGYLTALDTQLDDELIKEGLARELIRSVQEARKKSGLDVSDRIILGVSGSEIVESALLDYQEFLMTETLSIEWQVGMKNPFYTETSNLDDATWLIEIRKISV
jgi:isoleucyl-tRNA synthetase